VSGASTAAGAAQLRHSRVTARGVDFHVVEAGEGEPVLMLHGWPQHWMTYRDVVPAVAAAGRRAIAIDLPGYGWSGPAPHNWEKEEVVSDVLALMDEMGLERETLAGHDWGGWIGFKLCLRAPERFHAYLALNIPHPWNPPGAIAPHFWRFAVYQPLVAFAGVPLHRHTPFVDLVFRAALTDRSAMSAEDRHAFVARFRDPVVARTARDTYRTFLTKEMPALARHPEERRLEVKTHVLFGVDDAAISPVLASPRTAKADDYELELVEKCGHFIVDERPELVAERLLALTPAA
jgi:pimeloyl-ACP methyl ester carboxylesterase